MLRVIGLAAILLLPLAAADAVDIEAEWRIRGPAYFEGESDADIALSGLVYDARFGAQPGGSLAFTGDVEYTVHRTNETLLVGAPGAAIGTRTIVLQRDTTPMDAQRAEGSWTAAGNPDMFGIVVQATRPAALEWEAGIRLGAPNRPTDDHAGQEDLVPDEVDIGLPARGALWTPAALPAIDGEWVLQVAGPTLTLADGRTIATGEIRAERTTNPDGSTLVRRTIDTVILAGSGILAVDGDWRAHVISLEGELVGDLELGRTTGNLTIDGRPAGTDPDIMQMTGGFTVQAHYLGEEAHWSVAGDATFVSGNARTLAGDRNLEVVAGALTVAALLGIAAKVFGRSLLIFIGLRANDVLAHPTRRGILRILRDEPGITPEEMRNRLDVSRATLLHHLRVLSSSHFISCFRPGKIPHYALNSGSSEFQISAGGDLKASDFFTAVASPVRRAVFHRFTEGASTVAEARAGWDDAPSRQVIQYHVGKLVDAGVLEVVPGSPVRYRTSFDYGSLQETYAQRFVAAVGAQRFLDRCAAPQGCTPSAASTLLDGPEASRSIDLLEAAGIIERTGGRYKATPHAPRPKRPHSAPGMQYT